MKKILLIIFLLIGKISYANKVDIETREISLASGLEFVIPSPVLGAYVLTGGFIEVEVIGDTAKIKSSGGSGYAIVQVLLKDGSLINYKINKFSRKSTKVIMGREYKGYNLIGTVGYFTSSSGDISRDGNLYRLLMTTKTGSNGKFTGSFFRRTGQIDRFYLRQEYKGYFMGYGDINVQRNAFFFPILDNPYMRMVHVGYRDNDFRGQIWNGGIFTGSEVQSFNYIGGVADYRINNRHTLFATYWFNNDERKQSPWFGWSYRNPLTTHTFSALIGQSGDKPAYSLGVFYYKVQKGFRAQRYNIRYDLAENGIDNFISNSNIPFENFTAFVEFFDQGYTTKDGSFYIAPNLNYNVSGFAQNENYGLTTGWGNDEFKAMIRGNRTATTYVGEDPYIGYEINPYLDIRVLGDDRTGFGLRVEQFYKNFEARNFINEIEESRITFIKNNGPLTASLALSKFTNKTNVVETQGYYVMPSFAYRAGNANINGRVNFTLLSDPSVGGGFNPDILTMSQERYSLAFKYFYTEHHLLEGRILNNKNNFSNRDFETYQITYTYRTGHKDKSILSFLNSNNFQGQFFEDFNGNGIQEKGEDSVSGVEITLLAKDRSYKKVSDAEGRFKFSGIADDIYSVGITTPEGFIVKNSISTIDFSKGGSEKKIFNTYKVSTAKVLVKAEGNDQGLVGLIMCDTREFSRINFMTNYVADISFPSKLSCNFVIDVGAGFKNTTLSKNNIPLEDNGNIGVLFNNNRMVNGQVYVDKNNSGRFEIGEELVDTEIIFDYMTFESDLNGSFYGVMPKKIKKIKFVEVKGKKCTLLNNNENKKSSNLYFEILCPK